MADPTYGCRACGWTGNDCQLVERDASQLVERDASQLVERDAS